VIGVVGTEEVRGVPSADWELTPIGSIAHRVDNAYKVAEDADAWEALSKLANEDVCRLLVMDEDHLKGTVGRDGLELRFDSLLQGKTGGAIYRVDPAGFRVNEPKEKRAPVQGHNLYTSLDIDLQLAAERQMQEIGDFKGAAVALDVRTGEVLVLASKPDYDLNAFSPRLSAAAAEDINAREAWTNRAIGGVYRPAPRSNLSPPWPACAAAG